MTPDALPLPLAPGQSTALRNHLADAARRAMHTGAVYPPYLDAALGSSGAFTPSDDESSIGQPGQPTNQPR